MLRVSFNRGRWIQNCISGKFKCKGTNSKSQKKIWGRSRK